MKMYDAILVGGGPAGSTCAGKLQQAGLRVKLFDKKVFPRNKPCAGWITPQVIESLKFDVDDYRKRNIFQPITGFRTGILGGAMVETDYAVPVSYGIRRTEFDDYLLRKSNVDFENEAIKKIERNAGAWVINGQHQTPLLIGAGGNFCPVARYARQQRNGFQSSREAEPWITVYAQEVEFEMSQEQLRNERLRPEKPGLYFCGDLLGYGWCFRKGNYLNIGLGRTEKTGLSEHVHAFCDFLRANESVNGTIPDRFLGHAYKLYAEQEPILYSEGLLLIGDAAGLAYPNSGEGIRPAIESALIAAEVVAGAKGNCDLDTLSAYARRINERFGQPRPLRQVSWLPMEWLQTLASRLMATRWFAKNVVIENWFLNRRQPALTDEA